MPSPSRRRFLQQLGLGISALGSSGLFAQTKAPGKIVTARDYLAGVIYTKQEVDDWFAGKIRFAKHHPEWGWLLRDEKFQDGIDGAISTYTYSTNPFHERKIIQGADQKCRINTYGDSFTQGHQVNEGETWQEVLAAHLGEPVRNFGIGAWSVYQAYLRMKFEEERAPADLIILNVYDDDHYRNIDAWRNIRAFKDEKFLCPPLPHLAVNMKDETCEERPNPCPTKESIYKLCDLDWVTERFKDDFVLQIMLAHANAKKNNPDAAYKSVLELATTHGIRTRTDSAGSASDVATEMHVKASLLASQWVVEQVMAFAKARGKKALVVCSCSAMGLAKFAKEKTRFDQPFIDFLREKNIPHVDLLPAHMADFAEFNVPIEKYLQRYYIGHYTPLGNHFCAFAVKRKVVEMLDPKPHAYRN